MARSLDRRSPVLEKLADLYAESAAGTKGGSGYCIRYVKLLTAASCLSGERFTNAADDLERSEGRLLSLTRRRNLKSNPPTLVRVRADQEAALFAAIGRTSPSDERAAWAAVFNEAGTFVVPSEYRAAWLSFCSARVAQAHAGKGWKPFHRQHRQRAKVQLEVAAKLLAWNRPSLLRTVSPRVSGSSKFLEENAVTLQTLLVLGSGGAVRSFTDLGIEHNPATVRFHGPLRVRLRGEVKDYGVFTGESALSASDLAAAEAIETDAPRCVTVENATNFHELCRLGCGDLFVFTSHPNEATTQFLRRLPAGLPLFHFGDTDPWGFDVLLTLRKKTGRVVTPLHMHYRCKAGAPLLNDRDRRKLAALLKEPRLADVHAELQRTEIEGTKGDFEQESLDLTAKCFPYVAGDEST